MIADYDILYSDEDFIFSSMRDSTVLAMEKSFEDNYLQFYVMYVNTVRPQLRV